MGLFDLLMGKKNAPFATSRHSRPAGQSAAFDSQHTQTGSASSVRKDLLKLVMREMMTRNGIPPTWLAADLLRSTSARREPGLHVRFLVRHWDPRLMLHGVALERDFTDRLLLLDPQAATWLMGFSWQFAMEDTSGCPALPAPATWTAHPPPTSPAPLAAADAQPSSYGDVIQGPPVEHRPLDEVRADLERLLALRDDDVRRHKTDQAYAPTAPAHLGGQ